MTLEWTMTRNKAMYFATNKSSEATDRVWTHLDSIVYLYQKSSGPNFDTMGISEYIFWFCFSFLVNTYIIHTLFIGKGVW